MKKIIAFLLALAFLFTISLAAMAEETFDEASLYEAAKKEKEVNIYSYSSRVFKFGKTFEKKYPGIKVLRRGCHLFERSSDRRL